MAINSGKEAKEKLKILGMKAFNPDTVSYREVKIFYFQESLKWHPDRYNRDPVNHPASSEDEAIRKSQEINDAHADLDEFIKAREAVYTCPHCGNEASANVVRNGTFCCHCFCCGERKAPPCLVKC